MITYVLFYAALVSLTGVVFLLDRKVRKLQVSIEAVDVACETAFGFVGGDIGELFARVGDLEAPQAAQSSESVNDAIERLAEVAKRVS